MSEFQEQNTAERQERFELVNPMAYVEAWFDHHPYPDAVEKHFLMIGNVEMEIYLADQVYDTWLIKLKFHTARKAMQWSKQLRVISTRMGITQILKNNKLFLFKDTRF